MQCKNASPALQAKVVELCQTIVDQPEMTAVRSRIDAFMADDSARELYRTVAEKGEALHQKQSMGEELAETEIQEFERSREALIAHPVAQGFLEAREHLHSVQHLVSKFVGKTLELGRVPTDDDMAESCGSGGCNCH
jgi:cell fate (sporulation/competence/biofilm development) regulator YlbF (YheA/YmcA/DUF963 family)